MYNLNNDIGKFLILVFTLVAITSSCTDFLEEDPKDRISATSFFTESTHAFASVNSIYRKGPAEIYGSGGVYSGANGMLYGWVSGFFDNEYAGQEVFVIEARTLNFSGTNLQDKTNSIWEQQYECIARVNTTLKYLPETPNLSIDDEKNLEAQARFFRAFAYFILVRTFGDVPKIVEPYSESLENLYIEASPISEIYDEIILPDLKYAAENLKGGRMYKNGNRVTKTVAQALLAEVYLSMSGFPLERDMYELAAQSAEEVIKSNVYKLLANDPTDPSQSAYNKMRMEVIDTSFEYIYYVEYLSGIASNNFAQYTLPNILSGKVKYSIVVNTYRPTRTFLNLYDTANDLRVKNLQMFHNTFQDTLNHEWAPWIWATPEALENGFSSKNAVVFRYTDVLLTASEALLESNGDKATAVKYLAMVRDRSTLEDDMNVFETELMTLSQNELIEEVWKERYRETSLQFTPWFTMTRTRKFPVGDATGEVIFQDLIGSINAAGATYTEDNLFFHIPQQEKERNPKLN